MFFCSFYLKKIFVLMSLEEFLSEWNNDSPFIEVKTSGSTGEPKRMLVEKRRMLASARITCDFLGLRPGDTALLCPPPPSVPPPTFHLPPSTFHIPPSTFHLPHSTFHLPHSTFHTSSPSSLSKSTTPSRYQRSASA